MRAATCFSGIGAPECAAPWLDWRWCAEIEPFPAAVHAHRFPGVVNLGDVLAPDFLDRAEQVDVLVGGPPCQSFSIAGLRGGLADPRGNLTLRWVQVIHAVRPRYAVTENVPGWLSSNDNAFGCFLAGLVGADDPVRTPDGRSWPDAGMAAGPLGRAAWRVLDAQHFALAQRRRRVFVVFCPPDGGDPAAVLFERQGVRRHPAAGRAAGEGVARPLAAGTRSSGGYRHDADTTENLIAPTFNAAFGRKLGLDNQHIDNGGGFFVPTAYRVTGNDGAYSTGDAVGALGTMTDPTAQVIAFEAKRAGQSSDLAPTLRAMGHAESHPNAGGQVAVQYANGVRRLLPVETERLQGFPDGWTDIVYRGKPAADGNRYKAIGNSMAVPVLAWLLDRVRADALRPRTAA